MPFHFKSMQKYGIMLLIYISSGKLLACQRYAFGGEGSAFSNSFANQLLRAEQRLFSDIHLL